MRPFAHNESAKNQFDSNADSDCQQSLCIAFQDAEREITDQQNERDKDRRDEAVLESEQAPPIAVRLAGGQRRHHRLPAHEGSFTLYSLLATIPFNDCTRPEGQRITAPSICGSFPKPKCRRRSF